MHGFLIPFEPFGNLYPGDASFSKSKFNAIIQIGYLAGVASCLCMRCKICIGKKLKLKIDNTE